MVKFRRNKTIRKFKRGTTNSKKVHRQSGGLVSDSDRKSSNRTLELSEDLSFQIADLKRRGEWGEVLEVSRKLVEALRLEIRRDRENITRLQDENKEKEKEKEKNQADILGFESTLKGEERERWRKYLNNKIRGKRYDNGLLDRDIETNKSFIEDYERKINRKESLIEDARLAEREVREKEAETAFAGGGIRRRKKKSRAKRRKNKGRRSKRRRRTRR